MYLCSSSKQRSPAYTDRILWQENSKEVATLEQTAYTSHMAYTSSDHKPISAEFNLQIPVRKFFVGSFVGFPYSKSTIKTLEQYVKSVQS